MSGRGCLICGGGVTPMTSAASSNNTGHGLCSVDGIKRICLLHKILKIPLSKCIQYLEMSEESQDGMTFCDGCGRLVEEGEEIVGLMDKLESQMKGVQYKMMALLLGPQQPQGAKGQKKGLRSALIKEIGRRGIKFTGIGGLIAEGSSGKVNVGSNPRDGGMAKVRGVKVGQVRLAEEEEENGIVVSRTTSMSYQDQDEGQPLRSVVEEGNLSGDPLHEIPDEEFDVNEETEDRVEMICKIDPLSSTNDENVEDEQRMESRAVEGIEAELLALFCSNENMDTEANDDDLHQGQDEEEEQGDNQWEDEEEEDDEVQLLEECGDEGTIPYKKQPKEVTTSFISRYAELDAQKHYNNPNKVKVAPPSTSTASGSSRVRMSPLAPRKINPPLRLLDQGSDKYSGFQSHRNPERDTPNFKLTPKSGSGPKPSPHRNWSCVLCNKMCDTARELGYHYSGIHGNPTSWPCFVCSKSFATKATLYIHRRDVHKNLPINTQLKKRAAKPNAKAVAGTSGNNPENTAQQQQSEINKVQPIASSSRKWLPNPPSKKFKPRAHRNHFCLLCDTMFNAGVQLGAHYRDAHGNNPIWGCSECGQEFEIRRHLYLHRKLVHKNLPINQTRKLKRGQNLTKSVPKDRAGLSNVVKKTGWHLRSYICLICNKDCENLQQITEHYRTVHENQAEWPCFACHRVFTKKNTLYVHRRDHHKNLPVAGKAPASQSAGNSLTVIRAKIKVRAAKKNKILAQKRNMGRNYRCVICGEDCISGMGVAKHYKKEHPNLSRHLPCSQCSRIFNSYNSLYTHKRHYHKQGKPVMGIVVKVEKGPSEEGEEGQQNDSDEDYVP